jgi:methylated-DNA-[protein]-cysteine S-methyltransferase
MTKQFALFATAIGPCAIAWGGRGIVGVQLPEACEADTRARMRRRLPDASEAPPPPAVERAINAIVALLSGAARDLSAIGLDMDGVPDFNLRVYAVARQIPPGATLTYGEIARRLGDPGLARAVGQALGRNPFPIIVPCHRVLAAGGKLGGFSANGGASTKRRMLAIEGAPAIGGPTLFDALDAATSSATRRTTRPAGLIGRNGPKASQSQSDTRPSCTALPGHSEPLVAAPRPGKR